MAKFQSNEFLTLTVLYVALLLIFPVDSIVAQEAGPSDFDWLSSARIFILDAYTYPLYPKIEFDAEKLAETMVDMHADTLRVATSGHYYLIGGTQFQTAPDLGDRDILAECIAACKPRRIRIVPYIRTGGALAVEAVKPEWAYRINPKGDIPVKWDLGARRSALCWNTPLFRCMEGFLRFQATVRLLLLWMPRRLQKSDEARITVSGKPRTVHQPGTGDHSPLSGLVPRRNG